MSTPTRDTVESIKALRDEYTEMCVPEIYGPVPSGARRVIDALTNYADTLTKPADAGVTDNDHLIKALDRCKADLHRFIELASDYDLDEMNVASLETAIESMEMRKSFAARHARQGDAVGEIVTSYVPICSVVSMYTSDLPEGTKLYAAPQAQPEQSDVFDGDAPCKACGSISVDTGFECNDCGYDNASRLQPEQVKAVKGDVAERIERDGMQDRDVLQLIDERDYREEIIDQLCDAVLGFEREEWSSAYGFSDAVVDVQCEVDSMQRKAAQPEQAKAGDLGFSDETIDKLQDVMAAHGFAVPVRVISDAFKTAMYCAALPTAKGDTP